MAAKQQGYQQHERSDYEDLDKCHHQSVAQTNANQCTRIALQSQQQQQQQHQQQVYKHSQRKVLSMSDTNLNQQQQPLSSITLQRDSFHLHAQQQQQQHPHQQNQQQQHFYHHQPTTLSLGHGISIGSIHIIHPLQDNNPSHEYLCETSSSASTPATARGERNGASNKRQQFFETFQCQRRKQTIFLIFYICFYVIYLIIGGVSFGVMETPIELIERNNIKKIREDFLNKYPQLLDDDLEEFLAAVITANDRGISPLRNASNEMNWSFGQALFFSSTVVTTIGYGRVTPLSQTGKIFCIIYAAFGIPLTLVLLSAIVERLLTPANWLLGLLNSKLGHLYQPFNIRLLHLSIFVLIIAVLFFAIPTFIFAYLEPAWGMLDAFYYCFISLTTIGLGDYIPGEGVSDDHKSIYKMFITAYLILGLIAMMLILTIFYDIPQLNLGQLFTESVNGETEKLRLSSNNACYSGPSGLYMPQRDEDTRRAVVRIRPHGDDSPSPDEAPLSSVNRDIRVP